MAERLKKIRSKFDEIAKDHEALQLRASDGAKRPNNRIIRPPTGHMVDEAIIFGRDDEVTKVINLLLSEKENPISIISIIGKGGVGKTTIAQLVYKDERVHKGFDFFGWVCVSEDFDVKRLTKATIESVCESDCGVSELSPLQEKLAKIIKGKKLLLVLDDVWNENESLLELFFIPFKEAELVRFLVTTRNKNVTEVMKTTVCIQPKYLSENSCWQLFQRYAFGSTSNSHLVEMGREIMRKCGGLPLAVKSIGSLLRYKVDEESWREILESDLWQSNSSNEIFPALQISYAHLPSHLKPCLLICSMYPKDHDLKKMDLIELWISHGYIKSSNKKGVREVGVEYYEQLKKRSFLDHALPKFELLRNLDHEFCKLHDIIHDLCRLNSDGEHYSVNANELPNNIQNNIIPPESCHLYIRGFTEYVNQILQQNLKGLRSLSTDLRASSGEYCMNSVEAIDLNLKLSEDCMRNTMMYNLKQFHALRALELSGDCLIEIPNSITQLKHLSYLSISSDHLIKLPSSIDVLYNLQTLILNCYGRSPLDYLPENMGNLVNLRFLYIRIHKLQEFPKSLGCLRNLEDLRLYMWDAPKELPSTLGNCCKLKTLISNRRFYYSPYCLTNFPVIRAMEIFLKVGTIGWLKDMNNLEGEIVIKGLKNINNLIDARYANFRSKCKIKTLELSWVNYYDDPFDWKKNLIISLEDRAGCEHINYELLECLQPHPHLKRLVLEYYPCATLPGWMGDPLSLQAIQEIKLVSCPGLQSLPFSNLHTLKVFQISHCHRIRVMQLKKLLPNQLEKLNISWCDNLELISILRDPNMLGTLDIDSCKALKSITMDPCISSHEKRHNIIGNQDNTLSLKRLHIRDCPLLFDLPHEFVAPSGSCEVRVHGCGLPDLQI